MTGEAVDGGKPDMVVDAAAANRTPMSDARVKMTAILHENLPGFIKLTSAIIAAALRAEANRVDSAHDESMRSMAGKVQPFFDYLGRAHDSAVNMQRVMDGELPLDRLFTRQVESLRSAISTCILVLEQSTEGVGHLIDLVQAPGQNTPVLMQTLTDLRDAIHALYPAPQGRRYD